MLGSPIASSELKLVRCPAFWLTNVPEIRHVEHGVEPAWYDPMRDALLWTLEQALAEDLTPDVREAWTVCYDELAGEMNAAVGA